MSRLRGRGTGNAPGRAAATAVAAAMAVAGIGTSLSVPARLSPVHPVAFAGRNTAASVLTINRSWIKTLADAGAPVALSSPNVATLDGSGPAVMVGDRSGHVYALRLADGSAVPGWPVATGGVPVDSTPSVADLSGNGVDSVFVGVGNAATYQQGGYEGFNPDGSPKWFVNVQNPASDTAPGRAVQGSMAVANLQGSTDVVAGTLGQVEYAINAANGATLSGFPWFQADSNFTTPAVADLYGNGHTYVVEGGDSTAGLAYQTNYTNGGHLRILSPTGNAGTNNPGGGLVCHYDTDQVAQSSPAVGRFLANGGEGIAFGTGSYYKAASSTDQLLAVNTQCQKAWVQTLDGTTAGSPALADVRGNGTFAVVEGTGNGTVWALDGASGLPLWHQSIGGQIYGSVVTADLSGQGYQDVIATSTSGVSVLDGRSGQIVASFGQGYGFQNAALVTADPGGSIGLTVAGYNGSNAGVVIHYQVAGAVGAVVDGPGAWPMFHHDPQLTGDAGSPPPPSPGPPRISLSRLAGSDRQATAAAISQAEFPQAGSAGAVVLSREDQYADALAGAPLAARRNGPLLLSSGSALDPETQAELLRVLPLGRTVYILGGTAAVSSPVEQAIQALGYVTQRVAGADRFATAVSVAELIGTPGSVFEATGLSYPDALAAVPAAVQSGGVILLTDGAVEAPETTNYLSGLSGATTYALGGQAAGADPAAQPLVGADRYATAALVARRFFPSPAAVGIASGLAFPDALGAGPLLGRQGAPLLLVPPQGSLPGSDAAYLTNVAGSLTGGYAFGGTSALSANMVGQAEALG